MHAGGSGITPMLQVAEEILNNPDDRTAVSLVYANQSEGDIILRDALDALANRHSRFKVHYVVDKPNYGGVFWSGSTGYITKEIVQKHMPPPGDDHLVMVCAGLCGRAPDWRDCAPRGVPRCCLAGPHAASACRCAALLPCTRRSRATRRPTRRRAS